MNIYEDFSEDYEVNGATGQIMVPTRNGEVQVSDYDVLNGVGMVLNLGFRFTLLDIG